MERGYADKTDKANGGGGGMLTLADKGGGGRSGKF